LNNSWKRDQGRERVRPKMRRRKGREREKKEKRNILPGPQQTRNDLPSIKEESLKCSLPSVTLLVT